jgi:tetratricopeptide (TPR) repeat protein
MRDNIRSVGDVSRPQRLSNRIRIFLALAIIAVFCTFALAVDSGSDYSFKKADYWYKRGLILSGEGAYEEALKNYEKALQVYPENAAFWDGKAEALASLSLSNNDASKFNDSLQAYDTAIKLYNNSLKPDQGDANIWYYRGLALSNKALMMQKSGQLNIDIPQEDSNRILEEAIKSYEKAIEINPKYLTAWKNIGIDLYSLKRLNESLKAYDNAIKIDNNYALAWYNKGLALYELGDYDQAVQAYDNALKSLPENAAIWYNKGNSLYKQGDYDQSIECYDEAIKLNQSYAEAWHQKGEAYEKLGSSAIATAAFSKAQSFGYNG